MTVTKSKYRKINILSIVFMVMILLSTFLAIQELQKQYATLTIDRLESNLRFSLYTLDFKYPGAWEVKSNRIYKGDVLISGNNSLIDEIGAITESSVTVFLGNTRVATNVQKKTGERAIGTIAADYVSEQVLGKGEIYLGKAQVVDQELLTAYAPLKNSKGDIIGMWYLGLPDLSVKNIIDLLYKTIFIAFTGIIMMAYLLFSTRLEMKQLQQSMNKNFSV